MTQVLITYYAYIISHVCNCVKIVSYSAWINDLHLMFILSAFHTAGIKYMKVTLK
jgi:hypothetical protein